MNENLPVWRSLLFVPVTQRRFVDGAARRGADAIILDLEDSVAASEKERARTLEENMQVFAAAEVTAAPVYDIDQFLADPHVTEREIVVDVPDEQTGRLVMHNIIPRLSDTPGRLRLPAPGLGERLPARQLWVEICQRPAPFRCLWTAR